MVHPSAFKVFISVYKQYNILNISFNLPAFLYQEYRDTSKQQEIEQRRQLESLSPGVRTGTEVAGSSIVAPPTVQLQLRNSARSLSLWQNLDVVHESGLLTKLSQKEIIMQEVSGFIECECICIVECDLTRQTKLSSKILLKKNNVLNF